MRRCSKSLARLCKAVVSGWCNEDIDKTAWTRKQKDRGRSEQTQVVPSASDPLGLDLISDPWITYALFFLLGAVWIRPMSNLEIHSSLVEK